jgi:cobalt-precorrin-5B (C1)-methyltransferase
MEHELSDAMETSETRPEGPLRRGWTTGACAAAATRAAYEALVTGECPDPVEVSLPGGARPSFAVASFETFDGGATAGIVKDAGDDPDVTHGALVKASVRAGAPGSGVRFVAGEGVGTVTKAGLPIPPGEPAINPVPREMMRAAVREVTERFGASGDVVVEISIPGGEALAAKTLNGRLGIIGGLSILGTTGIVIPYSCAAWIHSIHRGIDVARASGVTHIAGSTGSTSETAVQKLHGLSETALIDMGDFVGGMLKYAKRHPVPRITIAGGFAKMTKLGQGLLDLHSRAGSVDNVWLSELLREAEATHDLVELSRGANTALQVLQEAEARGIPVGQFIAKAAWTTAARVLDGSSIALDVAVFDREGKIVGRWG